jgi:hypothetical protein
MMPLGGIMLGKHGAVGEGAACASAGFPELYVGAR